MSQEVTTPALQQIYEGLAAKNPQLKEAGFETFMKDMQDENNLKYLYEGLAGKNSQLKEYGFDSFKGDMFPVTEPEGNGMKGFFPEMGKRAQRGAVELNQMLANTPNTIMRMLNVPFNAFYRAVGLPEVDPQSFNQITGMGNVVDNLEGQKEVLSKRIAELNPEVEKSVTEAAKQGDWATFTRNLAGGVADSFAPSLAMMISGGSMGTTGMISSGAAVFGSGKLKEIDEMAPDMPENLKLLTAGANGALEGIFETYLGSGAVGGAIAKLVKDKGADVAKQTIMQSLRGGFSNALTKYPALAPFGEGFEEWGTQVAQNYVDKISGYRPDIDIFDGATDALLIGIASGGLHSAPIAGLKALSGKPGQQEQTINPSADNQPTITPDPAQQRDAMIEGARQEMMGFAHETGNLVTVKDEQGNLLFVKSGDLNSPSGLISVVDENGQPAGNNGTIHVSKVSDYAVSTIDAEMQKRIPLIDQMLLEEQLPKVGQEVTYNQHPFVVAQDLGESLLLIDPATGEQAEAPKAEFLQKQEEQVPEGASDGQQAPMPKPIITETIGKQNFDFTENEDGSLTFIPSQSIDNQRALTVLEKEFKDNPGWEVVAEKEQVEVPAQSRFQQPTLQTVVKNIQIRPKDNQNVTAVPTGDSNMSENVEGSAEPEYQFNGQPVSRDYAEGVIEDADSYDDLAGLNFSNDNSLQELIAKKFPETKPSYKIGKKEVSKDRALARIDIAKSAEQLNELSVSNDPDVKQAFDTKMAEFKAQEDQAQAALNQQHDKLVDMVQEYNNATPLKRRGINTAPMVKLAAELGYSVKVDGTNGIKVFKNGTEIRKTPNRLGNDEIQSHRSLAEYDQPIQDFANKITTPGSYEGVDFGMQPKEVTQAILDLQAGKKTVLSNMMLDAIEKMHNSGVIYLKADRKTGFPGAALPLDEFIAHISNEMTADEMEMAAMIPQDIAERINNDQLTPEIINEIESQIFGTNDNRTNTDAKTTYSGTSESLPKAEKSSQSEETGAEVRSEEVDSRGIPFVKASNGTNVFGEINEQQANAIGTNIVAPIKLPEGNRDYGKKHIAERENQLKQNGYNSTEEFVEDVSRNYDEIREGNLYTDKDGNEKETFLLVKKGDKGSVLYIELSPDNGSYNVNSGGIFKNSYINKRGLLWNASTEHSTSSAVTQDFPTTQLNAESDAVSALSQSSPPVIDNKDIKYSESSQEPKTKPQKGQRVFDSRKQQFATVRRAFKPQKGSALENEPFLIDITYDDGKKAMNMPFGDRFSIAEEQANEKPIEQTGPVGQAEQGENAKTETEGARNSEGLEEKKAGRTLNDALAEAAERRKIKDAASEVNQTPTEAQKEAGNYKKGHIRVQGMDITIEQPKGSVRSGKDASGKEWSVKMNNTYGYFKRTQGKDGDQVDVFIGENPSSEKVFVVDQVTPVTKSFDEHKVMLGFNSKEEAERAYLSNYEPGWNGLGAITEVPIAEFENWLGDGKRKANPYAESFQKNTGRQWKWGERAMYGDVEVRIEGKVGDDKYHVRYGSGHRVTADASSLSPIKEVRVHEEQPVDEKKQSSTRIEEENTNFVKDDNTKEQISEPVPQGEHGTEVEENSRLQQFADHLRRSYEATEAQGETGSTIGRRETESRIALEYAKENGLWIDEIYDLGKPFSSGNENTNAVDVEKKVVYKSNNLMNSRTISALITQLEAHNKLFPETKYDLVGFTGIDNGETRPPHIEVVFKQQLIGDAVPATEQEIEAYMTGLGFTKNAGDNYSNSEYHVFDLHPRNVLKDKDGDLYVIDNIIVPKKKQTTPVEKTESSYGKSNKIFTEDAAQKARELLRKKLGGQLSAGIDPEIMIATIQLAGYHIESGSRKFADFAKVMISDIGDAITPYLKGVYENIRLYPGMEEFAKEMDDTDYVKNYNFDKKNDVKPNKQARNQQNEQPSLFDQVREDVEGTSERQSPDDVRPDEKQRGTETVLPEPGGSSDTAERSDDRQRSEPRSGRGNSRKSTTGSSTGRTRTIRNQRNYVISEDYQEPKTFSKAQVFDNNLEAVEILVSLEKENRDASPDEQAILAKYNGWGGVSDLVLNANSRWNYNNLSQADQRRIDKLRELVSELDPDGSKGVMEAIKSSTANSFYTSVPVIRSIHSIIEKAGFNGGTILEPSMGSGLFFGAMQKGIKENSRLFGVELDYLTGKIAQRLYPDANVQIGGFQETNFSNNYFDVTVSNIPFGDIKVYDPTWKNNSKPVYRMAQNRVHNYFAVKMLDLTKPGGLTVFITSNGMLDAKGNEIIRRHLAENAEFLGAVRLPNTAFKSNANTEVTTDIIFLRKFKEGEVREQANPFVETIETELEHKDSGELYPVDYNEYFKKNREMMIGRPVAGGLYRAETFSLEAPAVDVNLGEAIKERIDKIIPKDRKVFDTTVSKDETNERLVKEYKGVDGDYVRHGNIALMDGKIGRVTTTTNRYGETEKTFIEHKFSGVPQGRIVDFIQLRNTLNELMYNELNGASDDILEPLRTKLNGEYDRYTKTHGRLREAGNRFIESDIDNYTVRSLERYSKGGKYEGKADIFSKRTINPIRRVESVDTPDQAILVSLDEYGKIVPERMIDLLGENWKDQVSDQIFELPDQPGSYATRDEYLSGNVKKKLQQARLAAETDKRFEQNVHALESVVPDDIPPSLISIRMGARWVPSNYYTQFAKELFDISKWDDNGAKVTYVEGADNFVVDKPRSYTTEITRVYGTERKNGLDLLEAALNDKPIKIYDKDRDGNSVFNAAATQAAEEKIAKIREEFDKWLFKDEKRMTELGQMYNDRFNGTVMRRYDGSHLTFPGLQGVTLRQHQKDADWMIMQNKGGVIDHIVGAGKTLVMITSAMEMRRTGISKKPMIVALKSTVPQIAEEFKAKYPFAKVLAPNENEFSSKKRKDVLAQIAANDWDAVILSHDQYVMLDHDQSVIEGVIYEELDMLDSSIEFLYGVDNPSQLTKRQIKGLQKRRDNLATKLVRLNDRKTDSEFTFEKLGIDHLFVDESHKFKNLAYTTGHYNVAGLGDPTGNQKTMAMMYGVRYLQRLHQGDKGTTFLSGTPISNSMVELYLILRYLRPNKLAELGMHTFDAWASTFSERSSEIEFSVTGQLKQKDRFRRYSNVPELASMYAEIADVRNDNNLILPKPKPKVELVNIKPSETQQGLVNDIIKFAKTGNGTALGISMDENKKSAKMLLATNISAKVAIDPRLHDESLPEEESSKINQSAKRINDIYRRFNEQKGVQLVFSDMGVPSEKFNVYHELKRKLTEQYGIPSDEIQFIHDYNTSEKKEKLFKRVNDGEVRVLIGSTDKMGTGVNVQQRVVALHHMDIPWNPAAWEQRNGRGVRQGNEIAEKFNGNEVMIFAYALERSLDAYKYQLLETKQRFINQIKDGSISDRNVDEGGADEGGAGFAEFVAVLSGNPAILDKAKIDKKVQQLFSSRRMFEEQRWKNKRDLEQLKESAEKLNRLVDLNAQDVAHITKNGFDEKKLMSPDSGYVVSVNGKPVSYSNESRRRDEKEAILKALKQNKKPSISQFGVTAEILTPITQDGLFAGHEMVFTGLPSSIKYENKLNINSPHTTFEQIFSRVLDNGVVYKSRLEKTNTDIVKTEPLIDQKFDKEQELADALAEQKRIQKILDDIDKEQNPTPVIQQEEDTTGDGKVRSGDVESIIMDKPSDEFLIIKKTKNTKTGDDIWLAKVTRDLDYTSEYKAIVEPLMKENNGYWSKFVKSMVFKTEEDANAFKEAIDAEFSDDVRFRKDSTSGIDTKGRYTTVNGLLKSNKIKKYFEKLHAHAKNAGKIHIVESMDEVPETFRKQAKESKVFGFYDPKTGESYFVTGNIANTDEAFKTWVHEVGAHHGLTNIIPAEHLNPFFEKIVDDLGMEEISKVLPDEYLTLSKAEIGEEYLAFLAEQVVNEKDLTPKEQTVWDKILDGISNILNKLFNPLQRFTRADAEAIVKAAVQSVYQSAKKTGNNSIENSKFTQSNSIGNAGDRSTEKAGLDNRRAMEGRSISTLVGRPESRSGIHKTVEAGNTAGSIRTVYDAEELEELESRGINPYWDAHQFRKKLLESAEENNVLLDQSYLDDKTLIHDKLKQGTSENDLYLDIDGKTITKVNDLSYVKGADHHNNLSALIDRFASHNALFPNAKYDLKGFIQNKNGKISLVLEQPFVVSEQNATHEELNNYLEESGFHLDGTRSWSNSHEVWSNGKYELFDARPANVLKGKDGRLYFIDTFPHSVEYMNGGDTGGFDPGTPNTRFRKSTTERPSTLYGLYFTPAGKAYRENKMTKRTIGQTVKGMREFIQDRDLPVLDLEKEIVKRGGKVSDTGQAYKKMFLSYGRMEYLYDSFMDDKMKPILKSVAAIIKAGMPGENVLPYMIAKHAPERNRLLREQELETWKNSNPEATFAEILEKEKELENKDYSGVMGLDPDGRFKNPDELAEAITREFESVVDQELIDSLWKNTKSATNEILDMWLKGNAISKEQHHELKDRYDYFVPLRGWREGAAKELVYTKGEGFSRSLKTAEGRKSLADNPLAHIQNVAFKALGEQVDNEVKESLMKLVLDNYDEKFHDLYEFKTIYYVRGYEPNPETGMPEEVWYSTFTRPSKEQFELGDAARKVYKEYMKLRTPANASEHEVIVQKPAGDAVIVMKGKMLPVAQAMNKQNRMYYNFFTKNHMDANDINRSFSWLSPATNFLKVMYTSANVVFPLTNFFRDAQEAGVTAAIKGENGKGVVANYKNAFPAIYRHIMGKPGTGKYDVLLKEFMEDGGQTGFTHLKTPEEMEKDINKELNRILRSGTVKGDIRNKAIGLLHSIESYNRLFEDATRFSVYITSRELGKSRTDAAYDAKEASVNFNRKGKASKAFDSVYAFFNVAIQSMQKNFKIAKDHPKRFAAVAGGFMALGFIEAVLNSVLPGDDDDDDYQNLSEYVRQNYLIIPNIAKYLATGSKGGKYLRIPLPQFWRGFHAMGNAMYDVVTGNMTGAKATQSTLVNFIGSLSPIDIPGLYVDGEFSAAPLFPTIVKPVVEVVENRNYMGYRIANEPFTKQQEKDLAASGMGKNNVNPAIKFFTDMLFRFGGGDNASKYYMKDGEIREVNPFFDINPSYIEHLLKGYTGGTGGVLSDVMTTAFQALTPSEEIDFRNVPFVNAFIRKTPEAKWKVIGDYYKLKEGLDGYAPLKSEYKKKAYDGKEGGVEKYTGVAGDSYFYQYKETLDAYDGIIDLLSSQVDYKTGEGTEDVIELMKQAIEEINKLKTQNKKQ